MDFDTHVSPVTLIADASGGNYTDNDVISDNDGAGLGTYLTFPGYGGILGGGSGKIYDANIVGTNESRTSTVRLWLFDAAPTNSELDDNAAFSLHEDDRTKLLGWIDFPAFANYGQVCVSQADLTKVKGYKCARAVADLYGILQDTSGETAEAAGEAFRISLYAEMG